MRNEFVNPEMEISKFVVEDIIATSNDDFVPGDNEGALT